MATKKKRPTKRKEIRLLSASFDESTGDFIGEVHYRAVPDMDLLEWAEVLAGLADQIASVATKGRGISFVEEDGSSHKPTKKEFLSLLKLELDSEILQFIHTGRARKR